MPGALTWVVALLLAAAFIMVVVAWRRRGRFVGLEESDQVEDLDAARHQELIRGTSMHLRELRYRYSISVDRSGRAPFTTEVNSVRLGFLPVVISDNASERQGYGYAAFVYDGRRWCGPGLPCSGGPEQALAHAARCVAPLAGANAKEGGDR